MLASKFLDIKLKANLEIEKWHQNAGVEIFQYPFQNKFVNPRFSVKNIKSGNRMLASKSFYIKLKVNLQIEDFLLNVSKVDQNTDFEIF